MLMPISNCMTAYLKGKTEQLTFLFFIIVFLTASCRKNDTDTIGADFIGKRNGFDIRVTDATSLIVYSTQHDSFPTRSLSYYLLGDMNDPVLGRSKANIYAQFSIPANQFTLSGGTIDSVILRLKPVFNNSYYGNISSPQEIGIYELKEQLINSTDSGYFSNRSYRISSPGNPSLPAPIGYYSDKINMTDSTYETVNGSNYTIEPHIRIKMSNAFVTKLQQAEQSGAFLSNDAFHNYINGLAILSQTPESHIMPGDGALVNINLRSSVSAVVIYYHNSSGSTKQEFPFLPTDLKTNQFFHKSNVTLKPNVNKQNPGEKYEDYVNRVHSNECYIQSGGGIKTRILMPTILDLAKDNHIAIIGAELVFSVQDGFESDPVYKVPPNLWLQGSDSLGRITLLADFLEVYPYAPTDYYGGTYNGTTHQYKFNIIRHIQNIINTYKTSGKDINYGLNLIIPADDYYYGVGAGRVVLNTNTALKKVKLNLSYTVIK